MVTAARRLTCGKVVTYSKLVKFELASLDVWSVSSVGQLRSTPPRSRLVFCTPSPELSMRVEDGNIDPAGWYTGPQNLYPADDPYQTVAQLEMARPWTGLSQSLNSRSQSMARSTSQSSLAVRSAARTELARSPFEHQFTSSRPATPTSMSDLISPASHSMETPLARSSAMLAGPAREVLRRNPDPTWITVPGSRQAPAVGVCPRVAAHTPFLTTCRVATTRVRSTC